jgi:hypothetical protein
LQNFHIISDDKSAFVLRIALESKANLPCFDWRTPLRAFFEKQLGSNWEMACVAMDGQGHSSIHLLRDSANCVEENGVVAAKDSSMKITVWMTFVNRWGFQQSSNSKYFRF